VCKECLTKKKKISKSIVGNYLIAGTTKEKIGADRGEWLLKGGDTVLGKHCGETCDVAFG